MLRRTIALTPFLLGSITAPAPVPHVMHTVCEAVEGSIDAHVDTLRPAGAGIRFKGRGRSAGDLAGTVAVDVVRRLGDPRFDAEFSITTAAGQIQISGMAHTGVGVAGVYPVRVALEVSGGTGAFKEAGGQLKGTGVADKGARTMAMRFTGVVCHAENAR